MSRLVLDASIAMVWCFPDEHSDLASRALSVLQESGCVVPSLWAIEVANALLAGERRGRLTPADTTRFIDLLNGISIETDSQATSRALDVLLPLSRTYDLTIYDATYLELGMREGLLLATLDKKLKSAAERAGVRVLA